MSQRIPANQNGVGAAGPPEASAAAPEEAPPEDMSAFSKVRGASDGQEAADADSLAETPPEDMSAFPRVESEPEREEAAAGAGHDVDGKDASWFRLSTGFLVAIILLAILAAANEIAGFVSAGFDSHPALGWIDLAAVCALLLLVLVVVSRDTMAWRRLSNMDQLRQTYRELLRTPHDLFLQRKATKQVRRYLSLLDREADAALMGRLRKLREQLDLAEDPVVWYDDIRGILLRPWDEEVRDMIGREARNVGLATAISPYGFLDAFIALWRDVRLVRRIAEVYHVRPGPMGTLRLLRRVAAAFAVADLTQHGASMLVGAGGGALRPFLGPMAQGVTNAAMTCRVGGAAQEACRPLELTAEERDGLWCYFRSAVIALLTSKFKRNKDNQGASGTDHDRAPQQKDK